MRSGVTIDSSCEESTNALQLIVEKVIKTPKIN
jgi:hypothetical protein